MSYELLQQYVNESSSIVFFGGAGVSTESGIPDFRSVDGLYNQKYDYPPETILSHTFFMKKPEEFFRFYRDKMLPLDAKPNKAHLKLAQWEKEGKLLAVVTQNIDGLHQAAGSKKVYELHGSIHRNYCTKCGKFFPPEYIRDSRDAVPVCPCGGRIKPDVVGACHCSGGSADCCWYQPYRLSRRRPDPLFPRKTHCAHQPRRHAHGFRM